MSLNDRNYDDDRAMQESVSSLLLRYGFLLLQIFILLALSAFPFKFLHFAEVRPSFFLIAVYYWPIFKPRAFPPWAGFLSGILLDLVYATPLGLNAFVLVLLHWTMKRQRRFLMAQSFMVLWMCFFLAAVGAFALLWLGFSIFQWQVMPVKPMIVSAALTGFLFPPMTFVFRGAGRMMERER